MCDAIAKKSFHKIDPLIFYGSLLIDYDSSEDLQHDEYLFDVCTKDLGTNVTGGLEVWGRNSVGSKVNDATSFDGRKTREANLKAGILLTET